MLVRVQENRAITDNRGSERDRAGFGEQRNSPVARFERVSCFICLFNICIFNNKHKAKKRAWFQSDERFSRIVHGSQTRGGIVQCPRDIHARSQEPLAIWLQPTWRLFVSQEKTFDSSASYQSVATIELKLFPYCHLQVYVTFVACYGDSMNFSV